MRPWIDSKGTSLGLTIFDREDTYTDYNSDGDEISQYVKTQKGINVSLGRQTGEYTRDYVTLETRKDGWKFDEDENSGYNYAAGPGTGTAEEKAAYPGYSWDNGDYDFAGKTTLKTTSAVQTVYLGRKFMTHVITSTILSAVNVYPLPFNGRATA